MNPSDEEMYGLPHHQSDHHPHISMRDRAAQFAPFAALTGHHDAVRETARLTDERMEPEEDKRELLNRKLQMLRSRIPQKRHPEETELPEVSVTYFLPDQKKAGGAYVKKQGRVRRLDEVEKKLVFFDGEEIDMEDVADIE